MLFAVPHIALYRSPLLKQKLRERNMSPTSELCIGHRYLFISTPSTQQIYKLKLLCFYFVIIILILIREPLFADGLREPRKLIRLRTPG